MSRQPKTFRRTWLPRMAMVLFGSLVGVVLADAVVGTLFHTSQRHLLRMPPNVAYRHHSTEFDYVFHTNSRGLRGSEIPLAKPPDAFRIAVVGDSFVAGFGVPDNETMTVHLERSLSQSPKPSGGENVQVINLGRSGTSTVRELDLYELLGRPYQPDVVILVYYLGNDLCEVVQEQDRNELRAWHPNGAVRRTAYALCPNLYLELAIRKQDREAEQKFGQRSEPELLAALDVVARLNGADPVLARERYLSIPRKVRQTIERGELHDWQIFPACYDPARLAKSLSFDDSFFDRAWSRTERHLNLLRDAVEHDHGTFVLVVVPGAFQVDDAAYRFVASVGYDVNPDWLTGSSRIQHVLHDWAEKSHVPYLDMTDDLRQTAEPLYYVQDGHFNPAGQRKAAQLMAEFLRSRKLVP
jgi:lysophospholipase L1-like esterase